MGAVALKLGDGTARFRKATLLSSVLRLLMLFSVVFTNLFALYAFTYYSPPPSSSNLAVFSDQLAQILREIDLAQKKLNQIGNEKLGYATIDPSKSVFPPELKLFLNRHPLPLGRDARSGMTEMVSSVGHRCGAAADLLAQFTRYSAGGRCPNDADLAQTLLARGCAPLPRRRCLSGAGPPAVRSPSDGSRWIKPRSKTEFPVDEVLSLADGIAVGFDVDGGDFAAAMAARNVTVVTGSPVNDGGAVFPLQLTPGQRFPFADSVFDLVRSGSMAAPGETLAAAEFLMFDFDRVLRAGGVLWLDCWRCVDEKGKSALTGLVDRFGFKKLKWVVGEKADAAGSGKVIIVSALLQKPARG
ncbi:putative methyltransferase At1g29790 [Wolffia australiana]